MVWNKGKKYTKEQRNAYIKYWNSLKGKTPKNIFELNKKQRGKNHPNWKGNKKITTNGYIIIYAPKHPNAHRNYVYEHRFVMEKFIKRYLKKGETVHHINHNKQDNCIKNLELLKSNSEHIKLKHPNFGKKTQFKKGSNINPKIEMH